MSRARFVVLVVAMAGLACHAQTDEFYEATFTCNLAGTSDQCGTTRDGKAMICYPGSQLGGLDFCTEACDPTMPAGDPRFTCLASGALLHTCNPHAGPNDVAGTCPTGLECYRTDLLSDEGICLMMSVCTTDDDCKDSARATCAATIIRSLSSLPIYADHLQCVKTMCHSADSNCPANESCLVDFYTTSGSAPDICLPNCDGPDQCPPNFACAKNDATTGSPRVCLPGLPGQRCQADQDCILGQCLETGAGFSECTMPLDCSMHADCSYLDGLATFACVQATPADPRRCISLTSFHGANCTDSSGCPDGEQCFYYSPYQRDQGKGECRVPCGMDLSCPVRGGIPHVCLDGGQGGCYPGTLGLPCLSSDECITDGVSGFQCLPASPEPRGLIDSPMICTRACNTDEDCINDPLVNSPSYCDQGLCRLPGVSGDPCTRDHQCATDSCPLSGGTTSQCP